ncbi:MAG: hypothetical protein NXI22_01765 [bacterium]|nr:hypothetical protein [bacterium]
MDRFTETPWKEHPDENLDHLTNVLRDQHLLNHIRPACRSAANLFTARSHFLRR